MEAPLDFQCRAVDTEPSESITDLMGAVHVPTSKMTTILRVGKRKGRLERAPQCRAQQHTPHSGRRPCGC